MNEQEALINELRLLLTDRFLDKLAIAVRVIPDLENRDAIKQFVHKIYIMAGRQLPNLEPYIEQKQSDTEEEVHFASLSMRGFL